MIWLEPNTSTYSGAMLKCITTLLRNLRITRHMFYFSDQHDEVMCHTILEAKIEHKSNHFNQYRSILHRTTKPWTDCLNLLLSVQKPQKHCFLKSIRFPLSQQSSSNSSWNSTSSLYPRSCSKPILRYLSTINKFSQDFTRNILALTNTKWATTINSGNDKSPNLTCTPSQYYQQHKSSHLWE